MYSFDFMYLGPLFPESCCPMRSPGLVEKLPMGRKTRVLGHQPQLSARQQPAPTSRVRGAMWESSCPIEPLRAPADTRMQLENHQ